MGYEDDISNEGCFEGRTDMVGDAKCMEKVNASAKTGGQMDRNKQLGFCVKYSLGQKKSRNGVIKEHI
jgi:hypothetical protein